MVSPRALTSGCYAVLCGSLNLDDPGSLVPPRSPVPFCRCRRSDQGEKLCLGGRGEGRPGLDDFRKIRGYRSVFCTNCCAMRCALARIRVFPEVYGVYALTLNQVVGRSSRPGGT